MSSVRKTPTSWEYILEVSRNGQRKQIRRAGFGSKREAAKALAEATLLEGDPQDVRTLGGFLVEDWLPAKRLRLHGSTLASYEAMVKRHVMEDPLHEVPLHRLDSQQLRQFLGRLAEKPGRARGSTLSRKTLLNVYRVLKAALNVAVADGYLKKNPLNGVEAPRPSSVSAMSFWTPQECAAFLTHCLEIDSPLTQLYTLALLTGARRGELLGLTWKYVDLEAGRITIAQARTASRYGDVSVKEPKSNRSRRSIKLEARCVSALTAVRDDQERLSQLLGPDWTDSGFVFTKPNGVPYHPDYIRQRFKRDLSTAPIRPIRFHDLRHTFASIALAARVNPKVVSEILGHASVAFTLKTYSHVLPGIHDEAIAAVGARMFGDQP